MNRFENCDGEIPARISGCYFNVAGGASNSQSNPVTNPEVFGLLKSNVQGAQNIAAQPFQGFGQPMSAGLSPTQTNLQTLLNNSPRNAGQDAMASGVTQAQAGGGDLLAGIQKYQNPYQRDVINTTMADMERSRQMQRVNDSQSATQAGAYGGSRHGVADSLTNEAAQRTGASTLANLNAQGFNTAAGLAQNDASRQLQSAQTLGQIGQAQGQQFLGVSNAMSQQGATEQATQQNALTNAYQEFLRQQNYPVEMQQLISQAMGLVPGAIGQSSKSSSWNASAGIL